MAEVTNNIPGNNKLQSKRPKERTSIRWRESWQLTTIDIERILLINGHQLRNTVNFEGNIK